MRSISLGAVLLLIAAAGCEHKSKSNDTNSGTPSQPPPGPPPDPSPAARQGGGGGGAPAAGGNAQAGADDVRPPTAADLAEYTKDIKGEGKLVATIETSQGAIHCELFGDKTPVTVANFVGLATGKKPWLNPKTGTVEKGVPFYDGLTFHRVIPEFMIQGGDPRGTGSGGPGYRFDDEVNNGLVFDKPGLLAMANAGPGTNGSQFFITEVNPDHLNNKHTIFGQCKEVDIVKKIARLGGEPLTMKVSIAKMQSW